MDGTILRLTGKALGCVLLLGLALPGRAATVEYIHTDALGSVVAVTDSTGTVIEHREYEPYGRQLIPTTVTDGPAFTGHVSDAATGLDYMQQRYYDPQIGRFLSRDPVTAYSSGDMRYFNAYAYAFNNPYKFTDPDGRSVTCDQSSCSIDCSSAFTCAADYGTVGVVIARRLIENAIDNIQRSESQEAQNQPEPGTAESDEGCIYCVDGTNTESGKDYVGSADDLDKRAATAKDGRDRSNAEKVDSYKKGDRTDRQNKEQKAMNERGGKENLDNKRNEVAPDKWKDRDIPPPNR